jgi:hypothetical protein
MVVTTKKREEKRNERELSVWRLFFLPLMRRFLPASLTVLLVLPLPSVKRGMELHQQQSKINQLTLI